MRKRHNDNTMDSGFEELVSQTGLGCMRDWDNGMVSTAIGGECGCLWTVRMPEGSLASMFVYQHKERWFANVTVFAAGPQVLFEHLEKLGPYPTMGHASKWAGKKAGEIAKRVLDAQSEEEDDD